MDSTTIASVPTLSRAELLAFTLPVLPLAIVGIVVNSIIIYLYVRFKVLRAEGGVHMMALLAVCDGLYSAANLQVSVRRVFGVSFCSQVKVYHVWEQYATPVTTAFFCLMFGGIWPNMVAAPAAQLANVALCLDRCVKGRGKC